MQPSNHELARRYEIKAKMLGLKEINFVLKPNDNVELIEVLDKESDGVFTIPEFITEFMVVRPRNGLYTAQPLFQGCHFTEIRYNNNPGVIFSGNRLFYKMNSNKLKVRMQHPECLSNACEMFSSCVGLKELDIKGLDTSNVVDMSCMFSNCASLTSLDLIEFNTSSTKRMNHMFSGCRQLKTLNLSSFDTRNVEDMEAMFLMCTNLEAVNLKSFNTSKVTNMSAMFQWCKSLKYLDLRHFDLTQVNCADYMLCGCVNMKEVRMRRFSRGTSRTRAYNNCGGVCIDY